LGDSGRKIGEFKASLGYIASPNLKKEELKAVESPFIKDCLKTKFKIQTGLRGECSLIPVNHEFPGSTQLYCHFSEPSTSNPGLCQAT
jgi:hypothetical protein